MTVTPNKISALFLIAPVNYTAMVWGIMISLVLQLLGTCINEIFKVTISVIILISLECGEIYEVAFSISITHITS